MIPISFTCISHANENIYMVPENNRLVIICDSVCVFIYIYIHPNSCKKGIPFGQALRIRRICSTNAFFEKQARELCNYSVERGYKKDHVEREIDRARRIPRADTLGINSRLTTAVFRLWSHFIQHCPISGRFSTDYTLL